MARRDYSPRNPDRDGTERFDSQLFVDDAIFVEPNVGQRKEMVIACWGYICRELLGHGALNEGKLELECVRSTSHIIRGFEANVESMTIRLPPSKKSDAWDKINHHMIDP